MQKTIEDYLSHLQSARGISQHTIQYYFYCFGHLTQFLASRKISEFVEIKADDLPFFEKFLRKKKLSQKSVYCIKSACVTFLKHLKLNHLFPVKIKANEDDINLKDFLNSLICEKGYSQNTVGAYRTDIRKFLAFLEKNSISKLESVDLDIFTSFLKTLYSSGLQASSVKRSIEGIKSYYRFLHRERIIKSNPVACFEGPKYWNKLPNILTVEEVSKLIESAYKKTPKELRDRCILELLYGCGLRVSELCDLKFQHFELEERIIRVFGKGSKERLNPFSNTILRAICEYWIKCRPNICPNDYAIVTNPKINKKIARVQVWRIVKRYAKKCGLSDKNIHPHVFRHSFATHMLDNGADIRILQDLLGHSSIDSTGRYLRVSLKQLKEKFHKYHPRDEKEADTPIADYAY